MNIYHYLDYLLGLQSKDHTVSHMIFRVLIIYLCGIVVLHYINKRFLGEKTPFDIILKFIIGSALASAITGEAPYFETLGMVLFIILLNWCFSFLSIYSQTIDNILKGQAIILYKNGHFQDKLLEKHHFTKEDILSELRKTTGIENLSEVKTIFLENSGEISVIPKSKTIRVHKNNNDDVD